VTLDVAEEGDDDGEGSGDDGSEDDRSEEEEESEQGSAPEDGSASEEGGASGEGSGGCREALEDYEAKRRECAAAIKGELGGLVRSKGFFWVATQVGPAAQGGWGAGRGTQTGGRLEGPFIRRRLLCLPVGSHKPGGFAPRQPARPPSPAAPLSQHNAMLEWSHAGVLLAVGRLGPWFAALPEVRGALETLAPPARPQIVAPRGITPHAQTQSAPPPLRPSCPPPRSCGRRTRRRARGCAPTLRPARPPRRSGTGGRRSCSSARWGGGWCLGGGVWGGPGLGQHGAGRAPR
jgi:hypothetical protein